MNQKRFVIASRTMLVLAGAVSYSPHRGRAIGSAVALVLVVFGTAWVLRSFLATSGG